MNKPTNNLVPITNVQQTQDIKLARGRGQQIPHPMGTETIELEGMRVVDLYQSLSPLLFYL